MPANRDRSSNKERRMFHDNEAISSNIVTIIERKEDRERERLG